MKAHLWVASATGQHEALQIPYRHDHWMIASDGYHLHAAAIPEIDLSILPSPPPQVMHGYITYIRSYMEDGSFVTDMPLADIAGVIAQHWGKPARHVFNGVAITLRAEFWMAILCGFASYTTIRIFISGSDRPVMIAPPEGDARIGVYMPLV